MTSGERKRHREDDERRDKRKKERISLEALGLPDIGDDDFCAPRAALLKPFLDVSTDVMATPFRKWLLEERGKHLTEISSKELRDYEFPKFCRAYNRGKLPLKYYDTDSASQIHREASTSRIRQGPTARSAPESVNDLVLRREAEAEEREAESKYQGQLYKRDRRDVRDEERDNRATGRDRLAEKRAEARSSNREFAGRNDGAGLEAPDSFLMGDDSFASRLAARDRSQNRRDEQRRLESESRRAEMNEKRVEAKRKEDGTMAMFREMAAARYG